MAFSAFVHLLSQEVEGISQDTDRTQMPHPHWKIWEDLNKDYFLKNGQGIEDHKDCIMALNLKQQVEGNLETARCRGCLPGAVTHG
jgi:hypothetical protein